MSSEHTPAAAAAATTADTARAGVDFIRARILQDNASGRFGGKVHTRFPPEPGYIVESRRGGNGYIRITRVRVDRQTLLMQVINTLGSQVDLASARAILNNLVQAGALEENAGRSILAAVGDKALAAVPRESRDTVRADIMKQVLILQV